MALIETRDLSRTYAREGISVVAVNRVNLTVEEGDFLALVGPSGSGKTTLLNLIGGLDRPTNGSVLIEGTDITELSPAELSELRLGKIGFVFQEFNLIPVLNALENVEYVMLLQGVDRQERRKRAEDILSGVGLEGEMEAFPMSLSGGQQQRVAVARAIAAAPLLVLADEPTANLDSKTGGELIELMKGLNETKGVTFVFSTHDRMITERAKKVVELKDGRVVSVT